MPCYRCCGGHWGSPCQRHPVRLPGHRWQERQDERCWQLLQSGGKGTVSGPAAALTSQLNVPRTRWELLVWGGAAGWRGRSAGGGPGPMPFGPLQSLPPSWRWCQGYLMDRCPGILAADTGPMWGAPAQFCSSGACLSHSPFCWLSVLLCLWAETQAADITDWACRTGHSWVVGLQPDTCLQQRCFLCPGSHCLHFSDAVLVIFKCYV